MKIKTFAVALALCALSSVSSQSAAGQKTSRPPARDTAQLRRAFVEAFGGDFEFVKEELVRRSTWHGGGLFWLAHAKPKRSGFFKLKYKYRYVDRVRPKDPLYEFVEHEIPIWVGEKGCRRKVQDRTNTDICLGDTAIIPVVLDDYTEHTFSLNAREFQTPDDSLAELTLKNEVAARADADKKLYSEPVANPLAEHLKYVGRQARISPHRAPGYTMDFYATFEALKPGSFNMSVSSRVSDGLPLGTARGGGVPVIIVERGTPVTMIASGEHVNSYGRGFSSGTGNGYVTTPLIMQPGDRITLLYRSYSARGLRDGGRGRDEAKSEVEAVKLAAPVITRQPFYVDPEDGFNQFIVDHLPVRNPPKAP